MRDPFRRWLAPLALLAAAPYSWGEEFVPCKNNYSPRQQIDLGNKAKAQVYQQTPMLPDDSPATQLVRQIGETLVAHAPGYRWPYNFHVANVAEINAFALPGGSIFVNLGTIQASADEAQLAGVMAHEITHVVLQHSVCNAEKQRRIGLFAGIGQLAAGVLLGGAAGDIAAEGIGLGTGLGFLRMSRGAERQADLEGVQIAYEAGFDPHGLPQFFETIKSEYGAGSAQFLSDHPNPGNRTEYVDKEIATFPPSENLIRNTPEFARVQAEVGGMHAYTAKEVSAGAWRTQSASRSVGSGVNRSAGLRTGSVTPDLNTSGAWKSFHGDGYSFEMPGNWKAYGDHAAEMIGPPRGIARGAAGGAGSVVHGMLTDRYQPAAGVRGAAALDALLGEIRGDNPGMTCGPQTRAAAGGVTGRSAECDVPAANQGQGEHDWVVAFQQQDGALRYFVFVAPTPDFQRLRPAFRRILRSLKVRS